MAKMMGIDVGKVRVGVALSDPEGILASPWRTLPRDEGAMSDIDILVSKIRDDNVTEVYVGLPTTLAGLEASAASDAQKYARCLLARLFQETGAGREADGSVDSVRVCMIDERMTTVVAHQLLHAGGKKLKEHRKIVDQVAAQEILQHAIESKRHQGDKVGIVLRVEI